MTTFGIISKLRILIIRFHMGELLSQVIIMDKVTGLPSCNVATTTTTVRFTFSVSASYGINCSSSSSNN